MSPTSHAGTRPRRALENSHLAKLGRAQFELEIKGVGKALQELREFRPNKQVRLLSSMKMPAGGMAGGHRFILTAEGNKTRIDHELEMTPKGIFRIFAPLMGVMGRKNLRGTAKALQDYLEKK